MYKLFRRATAPTLCALLFFNNADAADAGTHADARACAAMEWANDAGEQRAQSYRAAVDCLTALYVRVAAGGNADEVLQTQLAERLRQLESAYFASRDVCRLQEQLGLTSGGCGTLRSSPFEFVRMLKNMIVDADAGVVRADPVLKNALGLQ